MGGFDEVAEAERTTEVVLRTGVWHGESACAMPIPRHWDTAIFRPSTPPPLSEIQIEQALEVPCGQPPLRDICRNKAARRPLILVDDPNRPTPAFRVIPYVLGQFRSAGIASRDVKILVACGTHGPSRRESLLRKLGAEAEACQIHYHDPCHNLVRIGRTSLGTPVSVNRHVVESDLVIGIGGVYPNQTTGFGGGSKLALGVLGIRTIMCLHCYRKGAGWGDAPGGTEFRNDLDEIARMIGLTSLICLQVDSDQSVVRIVSGDYFRFYEDEVAFASETFKAPLPYGADVVISNAYPNDLSLTFVRKKGIAPLLQCSPGTSRIAVGACSEGQGFHRLYPYLNYPRFYRLRHAARRASLMSIGEFAGKFSRKLGRRMRRMLTARESEGSKPKAALNPIWLYRTSEPKDDLPAKIPGVRVNYNWEEIVKGVEAEQRGKKRLKVFVYPCAPLQWLDPSLRSPDPGVKQAGVPVMD